MKARSSLVAFAVLTAASALGCYPKAGPAPGPLSPTTVTEGSKRWPGTSEASLTDGRALFLAKCNNCHDYPDRNAIAEDRWPGILDKMAKKAQLEPSQREEVLHFILASRINP